MYDPNDLYLFDSHINPQTIMLVGLGGTGGHLARAVARISYDLKARGVQPPAVLFIDPDIVEAKNVGRQMFAPADVGQHKAELLARRFNYALGLNIAWRNEAFPTDWESNSYERQLRSQNTIVIGAVDNHEGRKAIAAFEPGLWIDCGNHVSSGQVIVGTTASPKEVLHDLEQAETNRKTRLADPDIRALGRETVRELPYASTIFPALLEPDPEQETTVLDASCADLLNLGQQHLLINDLMATVAAGYLYRSLNRQDIGSFMTYVDLDNLSMRSVPITRATLAGYLAAAEPDEQQETA